MAIENFDKWFADLLDQSEHEVKNLLSDRTATQFLIAWSILESKCFRGYIRIEELNDYAGRLVLDDSFDVGKISQAVGHFHARYQNETRLRHLLHRRREPKFEAVIARPLAKLEPQETVYLVLFTVYRFRNNIFHGNKGVQTWLQYTEQIDHCTLAMQAFISHAESLTNTMKIGRAE